MNQEGVRWPKQLLTGISIGAPPVPHEHGAWVILYAPLVLGFASAGLVTPLRWLLLCLAVTGAFMGREAAGLLLRKRGKAGTGFWLGVYTGLFLAGTLPLLFYYRVVPLVAIGAVAALLFCIHSYWLLHGRMDRSQWGEILGVGALTLTAPAAYATATGGVTPTAWLLWAACLLYYSSSIFTVKMFLGAAKAKRDWSDERRRDIGRDCLLYHLLLTAALIATACRVGGRESLWLVLAYVPALIRAFRAVAALTPVLPPLKRVGIQETLLAVWFSGCLLAAVMLSR